MQMMVIQYFYTEYRDDDDFSIPILKIQMMFQYSNTEDIDDDEFSIPILNIQMMFQYLHTVDADDGDLMMLSDIDGDSLVFTY